MSITDDHEGDQIKYIIIISVTIVILVVILMAGGRLWH